MQIKALYTLSNCRLATLLLQILDIYSQLAFFYILFIEGNSVSLSNLINKSKRLWLLYPPHGSLSYLKLWRFNWLSLFFSYSFVSTHLLRMHLQCFLTWVVPFFSSQPYRNILNYIRVSEKDYLITWENRKNNKKKSLDLELICYGWELKNNF